MITIKIIPKELTYPIRQSVLRKGKTIESCYFEGDNEETTFHFGVFINDELAGIASLLESKSDFFNEEPHYQLRGMAILEKHQNKKLGTLLLNKMEEFSTLKRKKLVWFNARKTALEFYKNSGYKILGKEFEIEDIGTHYLMFKEII